MQTETITLNRAGDYVRVHYFFDRRDNTWNATINEDDAPIGTGETKAEALNELRRHDLTAYAISDDEDDDEAAYWASHDREVQSIWNQR